MFWIKRVVIGLVLLFVAAFFHYTLPQHDIVQVNGTEVVRMDVGSRGWFWSGKDAGTAETSSRDVRFINTTYADGDTMVFRNEDTSWGWPPYFKFKSGDLQAKAQQLTQGAEKPWVMITHYGWRFPIRSIYPNAVSIKEVAGPNVTVIPWFNIVFFLLLGLIIFLITRQVFRFKHRHVDPLVDDVSDAVSDAYASVDAQADAVRDGAGGVWSRFTAWIGTFSGKARK